MTPTPYNPYIPLPLQPTYSQMDFPAPEFKQPLSTPPKLSLFSLPSKPPTLPDNGLTPPLNTMAAIPFLWEEAPGKPRPITSNDPPKSKIVRSLDLPPRLAFSPANNENNHRDKLGNNVGVEIIPSPTTVLDGPYEGVYVSNLASEKAVVVKGGTKSKGKSRMPLRKLMRKDRSPVKFRSWSWDRDTVDGEGDRSPPVRFCSWRWESFRRDTGGGGGGSFNSGGMMGKVARKNSFTFDSGSSTSRFLGNMYGTLKQAMPWRSR